MTQEDRNLLLKDLCARLPYETLVAIAIGSTDGLQWDNITLTPYLLYTTEEESGFEYIKPYLRPMSGMTDKEKEWIRDNFDYVESFGVKCYDKVPEYYDWLNAHHFDYRGLIEKGLALEAPKGMY